MDNIITVNFTEEFRKEIFLLIKHRGGPKYTEKILIDAGFHPSFIKGLIRNIMRKDGW